MGRTNCPGDTDGRGQVVSMKEEEYPNLTTVAIIALMPAQGLMRETVSTQEMDINDTLKHP